jgi:hypothetical protein
MRVPRLPGPLVTIMGTRFSVFTRSFRGKGAAASVTVEWLKRPGVHLEYLIRGGLVVISASLASPLPGVMGGLLASAPISRPHLADA